MTKIEEGTSQFKEIKEEWEKEARDMTLENLPAFLKKLTEDYQHDYGTICHAVAIAAESAAWAVNKSPSGGITGFQAGAVMWEFIRSWNYSSNKTGLKIVDYDKFLYPQYEDQYAKTISEGTWDLIQKEAVSKIEKADKEHAEWVVKLEDYKSDIAAFINKFPDYNERQDHYDPISMGNNDDWQAEENKKKSGFEFAPQEPYESVNSSNQCYIHWQSIVNGTIPFGYSISED